MSTLNHLPKFVEVVEVGPRDGLQNEANPVPVAVKVDLIDRLSAAGLPNVEAAAFVSPKWVPQMAGSSEVMAGIRRRPGTVYSALVPNMKGMEAALAVGVDEVVVFSAASEAFALVRSVEAAGTAARAAAADRGAVARRAAGGARHGRRRGRRGLAADEEVVRGRGRGPLRLLALPCGDLRGQRAPRVTPVENGEDLLYEQVEDVLWLSQPALLLPLAAEVKECATVDFDVGRQRAARGFAAVGFARRLGSEAQAPLTQNPRQGA